MDSAIKTFQVILCFAIIGLFIAIPIVLCTGIFNITSTTIQEQEKENEAIAKVKQGVIVDKNISDYVEQSYNTKKNSVYVNTPTYTITLEIQYRLDDELKTTQVTKTVEKDIYLSVNKGDIFDLETLSVINKATATDSE